MALLPPKGLSWAPPNHVLSQNIQSSYWPHVSGATMASHGAWYALWQGDPGVGWAPENAWQ